MHKTKFGMSVGLFGAALYFVALTNIIPLVIMAGYVLIFEENDWLRRTAAKAVAVVLFFVILSALVSLIGHIPNLINDTAQLFGGRPVNMLWLTRSLSIIRTVLSIIQTVLLLMMGFKAFKQGKVNFGLIDNTINNNM